MKKLQNNQIDNVITRRLTTDRLRRFVALMSAFVLFITMNTLKLNADTLERIPTCGYGEHIHTEDCYDASGDVICGVEAHVHTDACYQQRPTGSEAKTRLDDFIPLNASVVLASAVDSSVSETEVDLVGKGQQTSAAASDDNGLSLDDQEVVSVADETSVVEEQPETEIVAQSETEIELVPETETEIETETETETESETEIETESEDELPADEVTDIEQEPEVEIGERASVALDEILLDAGLELGAIAEVGIANEDEGKLAVETAEDGSITVVPLASFERAEIVVIAEDGDYAIALVNAVVNVEENDQNNIEETADETTKVPADDTAEETIDETVEPEAEQEAIEEPADETEVKGDAETEENTEVSKEQTEVESEEQTDGENAENADAVDEQTEVEIENDVEKAAENDAAEAVEAEIAEIDEESAIENEEAADEAEAQDAQVILHVDFSEVAKAGIDYAEDAVVSAAGNDGVALDVAELLNPVEETQEKTTLDVSVEDEGAELQPTVNADALEVVEVSGGVSFEDGAIAVTGDGSVALTDGDSTVVVNVYNVPELVENVTDRQGSITIEPVSDTAALPAGEAVFEAIEDEVDAEAKIAELREEDAENPETVETDDAGTVTVRTRHVQVFDIGVNGENDAFEPGFAVRVRAEFDQPIEGQDFELYHIVDGEPVLMDNAVVVTDQGATGLDFETDSFSPYAVVWYTVDYATTDKEIDVTVDFKEIVINGVDFDEESVISALNDGVAVNLDELEKGYGENESAVQEFVAYSTADNKVVETLSGWAAMQATATEGLSVENGQIRVTADGEVVLTDGETTIVITIKNYTRLLADNVAGEGVSIDVLEGEVPAGSTVAYTSLNESETNTLVENYNIEETASEKVIEDHNILDSATGYTAFDVSILQPEGDAYTEGGKFNVAVDHTVDVDSLIPDGAKLVGVNYTLYHIHDGEAQIVDDVDVVDGKVLFTTDSFSEYVLIYTIDFTLNGYTFSYPGRIPFLLSDLLFGLHIDVDAADVVAIDFSNNDLFTVTQVEGDWEIEGVESFTTEETMVLTLNDGSLVYIFATDPEGTPTINLNDVDGSGKSKDVTSFVASVSKAVEKTEQGRDSSFKMNFAFELTDEGFAKLQAGATGDFPTIVYDMTSYINDPDVPIESIQNMSSPVYDGDKKIGTVVIKDGVAVMTITNLDWLASQTRFDADFDLQVNTSSSKLGTRDEYNFDFPGTTQDYTIKYKKITFDSTKTVNYNGRQEGDNVVLAYDKDGNYLLTYTVRLNNPTELDKLNFTDTMTGNQYLYGDVTVTGAGKSATVSGLSGSKSFNFNVLEKLGIETAPAGEYVVTYTAKIDKDKLKTVGEDGVTEETNTAQWTVTGDKPVNPDPVVIKPEKDYPPMTVEKKVNGQTGSGISGFAYGSELNYAIEFGNSEKPMAGITIYDQMTDNQKLNGSINIEYYKKDGTKVTDTIPADSQATDTSYSNNRVTLFNYTLPSDVGNGPVKVTYKTNIISQQKAIDNGVYGTSSVLNNASSQSVSSETEGKVTFPEKPVQKKEVSSTQATDTSGRWQLGDTLTYTLTYGSKDVPLKGTEIKDVMTKLQNLEPSTVTLTYSDGSTLDLSSAITWTNLANATDFSTDTAEVFHYTFPDGETHNGPVTITYTTKLITSDQVKELNISGDQSVNNTFYVNNNPSSTSGRIPTNTPNEVAKSVKNITNPSSTNWAPGDEVEYTIELKGDRLNGSVVTDYATDVQTLASDIEIRDKNGTLVATISKDSSYIGEDFKDTTYSLESKKLFEYTIPAGEWVQPLTATYKMQIIDETTANRTMHLYGLQGVGNRAYTNRGGNGDTGKSVDFGEEPYVPRQKQVSGSQNGTDVQNSKEGWQPGEQLNYTITFGNDDTWMSGYELNDRMTNLQHLIVPQPTDPASAYAGDSASATGIKIKYKDKEGNVKYIDMPSSAITRNDDYWSNSLVQLFQFTMPEDAGFGTVTITYSTQVISLDKATELGIYDLQKVENRFTLGGETVTTWGDVPFKDDPKPKKKVENVTREGEDNYQPGEIIKYTATFGDNSTSYNGSTIYDNMNNVQTLVGDVVVSYYDGTGTQHSFVMPQSTNKDSANPGGVTWSLVHTEGEYYYDQWTPTNGMQMVFNYQLPASDATVTGTDENDFTVGDIMGPVTVTYNAKLMSQEDATRCGIYVDVQAKNCFYANDNPAMTSIDVPYEDQATHLPQIQKTAYVDANGNPVWPVNGDEYNSTYQTSQAHHMLNNTYLIFDAPSGAHNNVDVSDNSVTWIMEVSKADGENNQYPLTDIIVTEHLNRTQGNVISNSGRSDKNLGDLMKEGLVDAVEAQIISKDTGEVLVPGADYSIFFSSQNPWTIAPEDRETVYTNQNQLNYFFPVLNGPVYIKLKIHFAIPINGYYVMGNMVSATDMNGVGDTDTVYVSGYNTDIVVQKSGESDENDPRLVKWTVEINKNREVVDPDWDAVMFSDILPDGMIMVNADDPTDHTHPSIHINSRGLNDTRDPVVKDVTVENGVVQPVDIHIVNIDANLGTIQSEYFMSGMYYWVEYYTYIEDDAWEELTSSTSGTKTFTNTALFTDGDKQTVSGSTDVTVEKDDFVSKKDVSQAQEGGVTVDSQGHEVVELQSGDMLAYLIEVNPDGDNMNNGTPLKLTDTIPTSMNFNATSIRVFEVTPESEQAMADAEVTSLNRDTMYDEHGDLITAYMGTEVTKKVNVSYNDDTRVLTIENIPDGKHYRVFFEAKMRSTGGTEVETFNNTVTLYGAGSYSDEEESYHKTSTLQAHAHGGMSMRKLDENNIKKGLEGAVFELYRVYTTQVELTEGQADGKTTYTATATGEKVYRVEQITVGADENGQYTSDKNGDVKFGTFEFSPNTLYYWVEKQAPEGYVAELDVPHYFVLYNEVTEPVMNEDETEVIRTGAQQTQLNMLQAWAYDNFWEKHYDITVASYPNNSLWYATNSQYRSITATKKWEGDSNNLYKMRPEDGIKLTLVRINADGSETELDTRTIRGGNENQWLSYTWNFLDVYDEEGNEYKYTVKEELLQDYYPEYSDGGDGITSGEITIVNRPTPGKTSVEVEKVWKIGDNIPSSIEVQLVQIYTDADNNSFAMDDEEFEPEGYQTTATLIPDQNGKWSYVWNNLPTKDGKGGKYSYTVKELTNLGAGIEVKYSDNSEGIVKGKITITNYKPGALIIDKKVTVNGMPTTGTAADGEYKFNIIDENGTTVKNVTITVKDGAAEPLSVSGLVPGEYTVREVQPTNGTAIAAGTPKEYTLTVVAGQTTGAEVPVAAFTNNKDTTRLTVKKEWYDDSIEWPEGMTATIHLVTVDENGNKTTVERVDATVVLDEENQTYTWTGLDASLNYSVTEDSIANFVTEISEVDNKQTITVTNKEATDLTFKKVWEGTAPANWLAEVKLVQREKLVVEYGEPVSTEFEGDYVDAGYEHLYVIDNNYYTFEDLPKYRHDGNSIYEIEYSVEEVKVMVDGQDVTDQYTGVVTDEVATGAKLITNTPSKQLPVEKIWEGGKLYNVKSVEFTLYQKGTTTKATRVDGTTVDPITLPVVDGEGNEVWTYTYTDLPRDGQYELAETKVTFTDGKSITGNAITKVFSPAVNASATVNEKDGITITNHRETVDIPVHKNWEGIDLSKVQNVSFTLYSVTTKNGVEKEQKVSKDADGNAVNATINNVHKYDSPEDAYRNWRAEWKNLPKYDSQGNEIVYRVRETRVQANSKTYNGSSVIEANWGPDTWKDVEYDENGDAEQVEITNKPVTVELTVSKRWTVKPVTDDTKVKVTIALLRDGNPVKENGDLLSASDDASLAYVFELPTDDGKWFDSISNLPKYDNTGRLITWSIKETQIVYTDENDITYYLYDEMPAGQEVDATHMLITSKYTVNGEGEFVFEEGSDSAIKSISNNLPEKPKGETMSVTLNKVWDGTAVPENAWAKFTLHQERIELPVAENRVIVKIYASNKRTVLAEAVLDKSVTTATLAFTGTTDGNQATFKYVNGDTEFKTASTAWNSKSYSDTVNIDWTKITEATGILELYVNKKATDFEKLPTLNNYGSWTGAYDGIHSWQIKLSADPTESYANYGTWGYIWDNLPKIDPEKGYSYRYYITEDESNPDWFIGVFSDASTPETALTDNGVVTATNKEGLKVTKKWVDVYNTEYTSTPPESTIYFKLLADDNNNNKGLEYRNTELSGWDSSKYMYKLEFKNGAWTSVNFGLLPETFTPPTWSNPLTVAKYYVQECDESGNAISSSADYIVSYDLNGNATTGFTTEDTGTVTITNKDKPDETKIYVKKVWDGVSEGDQKPVTVELWAKEAGNGGDSENNNDAIDVTVTAVNNNNGDVTNTFGLNEIGNVKAGNVLSVKLSSNWYAMGVTVQYSDDNATWVDYQSIDGKHEADADKRETNYTSATVIVPSHSYLRFKLVDGSPAADWVKFEVAKKENVTLNTESALQTITISGPSWTGEFSEVQDSSDYVYYVKETLIDGQAVSGMTIAYEYVDASGAKHTGVSDMSSDAASGVAAGGAVTVTNTKEDDKGHISVTKADVKDVDTNESITVDNSKTFTFQIKDRDTVVDTLVVKKGETKESVELELGETYTIEETTKATIDGYTWSSVDMTTSVTLTDTETVNVSAINYYTKDEDTATVPDSVTVNKQDEDGSALPGATFTLYSDEDCTEVVTTYGGSTVSSFTISTEDTALASYLPESDGGSVTLYLKETVAPNGYVLSDDVYEVVIETEISDLEYDNSSKKWVTTTTYTMTIDGLETKDIPNTPDTDTDTAYNHVTVYKTDGTDPLTGATFTLYSGSTAIKTYGGTNVSDFTIETDDTDLAAYLPEVNETTTLTLKETTAPANHKGSTAEYSVVIGANESTAWNVGHTKKVTTLTYTISINGGSELTVPNTPVGSIEVTKLVQVDGENSTELNGQTITIGLFDTEPADDATTDTTATLTISGSSATDVLFDDLEMGTYYVYELDANGHPVKNNGTVTLSGTTYTVTEATPNVTLENAGDTGEVTITNSRTTQTTHDTITVTKQDQDGDPVADATFTLYQENKSDVVKTFTTTTETNGNVFTISTDDDELVDLLPTENNGTTTLYLKETVVPEGYKGDTTEWHEVVITKTVNTEGSVTTTAYTITIDDDDEATITNTELGSLKITKIAMVGETEASELTDARKSMADGTYTFNVYSAYTDENDNTLATKADGAAVGNVTITITNGVATSDAEVTDLVPGTYYVKETSGTNNAVTLDSTVHEVTVVAGETGANVKSGATAEATNTLPVGNLTVTKTLASTSGETISGTYNYPVQITVTIDDTVYYVQDADGALGTEAPETSLTVSNVESLTISNLPYGRYTVTETNPGSVAIENYSYVVVENDSKASDTAVVGATTGTAALKNNYTMGASWTPEVGKLLNKQNYDGDAFSFVLTETTSGSEYAETISTATSGKVTFTAIPYTVDDVGVHTYTITEMIGSDTSMRYDTRTIYAKVMVTNNSGTLSKEAKYYSDEAMTEELDDPKFENTELGSVKVTKEFSGIAVEKLPENFKITATWTDGEKKTAELMTDGTQPEGVTREGEFPNYTWTITGVPVGTEVSFTESGYGVTGYNVVVTGSSTADDKTTATAEANKTPGEASFINTYTETTSLYVQKRWMATSGDFDNTFDGGTIYFHLYLNGVMVDKDGNASTNGKVLNTDLFSLSYSDVLTEDDAPTAFVNSADNVYIKIFKNLPTGTYTLKECTSEGTELPTNAYITCDHKYEDLGEDNEELTVQSVKNTVLTIKAKKNWNEPDGFVEYHPEITFTLYKTTAAEPTAGDWVFVKSETLPAQAATASDDDRTVTFGKYPQYTADGTLITYKVEETVTDLGYERDGDVLDDAGGQQLFVVTNKPVTTTVEVTKAWENADGTTTAPAGATVTLTLYKGTSVDNATTEVSSITLNGKKDLNTYNPDWNYTENTYEELGDRFVEHANEDQPWKALWSELPKYVYDKEGNGTEIVYIVKETSQQTGYTVSYSADGTATYASNSGTITNTQEEITLSGTKTWVDEKAFDSSATNTNRPDELEIKLYTVTTTTTGEEPNVETEESKAEVTLQTENAEAANYLQWDTETDSNVWTYTITNLPKTDADGNNIVYRVEENVPDHYKADNDGVANMADNAATTDVIEMEGLVNTEVTTVSATKIWMLNGSEITDPEEITEITLHLNRTNGETGYVSRDANHTFFTTEAAQATDTTYQPFKIERTGTEGNYSWPTLKVDNLPKYYLSGNEVSAYTYFWTEGSVEGWTVSYQKGNDDPSPNGSAVTTNGGETITITNSKWNVSLPSTGGTGTTIFYGAGLALMLFAVLGFILNARKRSARDGI